MSSPREKADNVDTPIHAKVSTRRAQPSALASSLEDRERQEMRRGGEGRGGSRAAGVSNTRVTQLFQLICYNKAVKLLAYKCTAGSAGWLLPSRDRRAARVGPHPRLPREPQGMAQDSPPACPPLLRL